MLPARGTLRPEISGRRGGVYYPCLQTRRGTKPGVFYIRRGRMYTVIFSSGRYYGGKNKGRTKWVEVITEDCGVYAGYIVNTYWVTGPDLS